jgi:hypothetical protein
MSLEIGAGGDANYSEIFSPSSGDKEMAKQTLALLNAGKFEGLLSPGISENEVRRLLVVGQKRTRRDFLGIGLKVFRQARQEPDRITDGIVQKSESNGLGQGVTRRNFIKGVGALGIVALLFERLKKEPVHAEPTKLPLLEMKPGSTLEQTSVRCLGGIHVVTVPSFSIILVRFYAQAAMEMAARSTGRLDANALSWAFREIRTKVERANKDYNPEFSPDKLQIGDRVLLPPDELLEITSLSISENQTPIEVVVIGCSYEDCGDSAVGWMYNNRPRVIRIHGFNGPGEALKSMKLGESGIINASWKDGRLRPVLKFKVIRKEIQPGKEYDYDAPGVFLVAEDFGKARTISCAVQDGSKVCLLELELSLP